MNAPLPPTPVTHAKASTRGEALNQAPSLPDAVDTIALRYERRLDHGLDPAFRWLTDYRDDDAQRAGAIVQHRRVLERSEDRIVLEGELETLGRAMEGTAVVKLDKPAWTAHLYDTKGRPSGLYEYKLEPDGSGSRLVVSYRFAAPKLKHKIMLWLSKPLIRRRLDAMWDGFEAAMDEELA